jgi:WD40 repeat protein/sterol desaturase/sphingolipid hydroxylase (fatty acid hydroxylase superfamily)
LTISGSLDRMDWMATIGDFWLQTLAWLAGLAVAFGILARLMPCNPGMYWWKNLRGVATDFVYWFIVPLFLRLCRLLMLIAGVVLLFGGRDPQVLPVKDWPLWQQCLAILLIQDVLLYWIHRVFHTRLAWNFHAIHHSPRVLDWMAAGRFHPINNLLTFGLADVAVLLLGFPPAALFVLTPFNTVYSAMVHANLNWTFGPLRYVFASPVFHRWHHTGLGEGIDKNFASTFPFLDVVFGTFYMPPGKLPEQFGNGAPDFPEGFWGQFIHPFLKKNPTQGTLKGSRRRLAPALRWASFLTVVGLLGGGVFFTVRLANRNEQLTREVERAEAARQALQLDGARRALAENDLVRAGALLDEAAGPGRKTEEERHLRDRCRRKCLVLAGHTAAVRGVAISADGRRIVSGGDDGTVRVWDAAMGTTILTLTGHTRPVRSVAITADGRRIISGSFDRTVKVWDGATGREEFTLTGHTAPVLAAAVSADGQHIVSGSVDLTVRVWDAATGQEELTLRGDPGAVPSVAISADGRCIVSAGWGTAKVWDGRTGREKFTLTGHTDLVYDVAMSPDGQHIVSGSFDARVKVWDATTGREQLTLEGHTGPVYGVAISPDGKRIVSGGKDRTVKVWDAAAGREELTLKGHTDSVTSVAVTADGRRIVSGSEDGTVKVWDAPNCRQTTVHGVEGYDKVTR